MALALRLSWHAPPASPIAMMGNYCPCPRLNRHRTRATDEAEWHLANGPQARTGFVEKLAALANHFERAMVTFLDYNQFWKGATRFYHADTLPYWRKRKNLPHLPAVVENRRKLKLENDKLTSSLSMARQRSRPPWASIARSRS